MLKWRLVLGAGTGLRHALARALVVYALAYPALVLLTGHRLPAMPVFAVPCPSTLFTAGVLLATAPPLPRVLLVVPVAWSVVGGSAAFVLGMTPDLMLFAAGACLVAYGFALPRSA